MKQRESILSNQMYKVNVKVMPEITHYNFLLYHLLRCLHIKVERFVL